MSFYRNQIVRASRSVHRTIRDMRFDLNELEEGVEALERGAYCGLQECDCELERCRDGRRRGRGRCEHHHHCNHCHTCGDGYGDRPSVIW